MCRAVWPSASAVDCLAVPGQVCLVWVVVGKVRACAGALSPSSGRCYGFKTSAGVML